MIVKQTTNKEEIRKVLCHPEIYPLIQNDDSGPSEDFDPPMDLLYVGGYLDEIIGIMIYHDDWKCHIQVLPEYRDYSEEFARMALDFGGAKNADIYAEIPDCYPNVIRFAEKFGFKQDGIIVDKYLRHGERHNVNIMRRK